MGSFKKKIVILAGIAIAINLILGGLLFYLAKHLSQQTNAIAEIRRETAKREAALSALETLRRDADQARPYITELQEILPTKDQLTDFPKEIAKLAKANEVNARFSFGEDSSTSPDGLAAAAFRLTVSGTYGAITNFLNSLETGKYLVAFEKVDVAREPVTKKYSALVAAKIYYQ